MMSDYENFKVYDTQRFAVLDDKTMLKHILAVVPASRFYISIVATRDVTKIREDFMYLWRTHCARRFFESNYSIEGVVLSSECGKMDFLASRVEQESTLEPEEELTV